MLSDDKKAAPVQQEAPSDVLLPEGIPTDSLTVTEGKFIKYIATYRIIYKDLPAIS